MTNSLKTVFFILGLPMLLAASSCSNHQPECTTIYLVRHAEKDLTDSTDNPPLTIEGEARAQKLVKELSGVSFDGIFSTNLQRTMNTVLPIANKQDIQVVNYPYYQWQTMLDSLKITYQKYYLIGGHGDILLPMIEYLGAKKPQEELGANEYDKIFKVSISIDSSWVEVLLF